MLKKNLILVGLIIVVMTGASCIFDPPQKQEPCKDCGDTGSFLPLTTKEAVLNNLQRAYNKRNVTRYDELLDTDFTFFFALGDVGAGIPENGQWGRADEIATTTLLFDPNYKDPNNVIPTCRSIRMNLQFESGVQWVELIPEAFPDEVWYTTTVFYDFTIEMKPDLTLIAQTGSSVQFTVRNKGTIDAPHWQLVEFRDLGTN